MLSNKELFQFPLMPATGRATNPEFSTTAEMLLTTVLPLLVLLAATGLSKTHGVQLGEKKDISDFKPEILVPFAKQPTIPSYD